MGYIPVSQRNKDNNSGGGYVPVAQRKPEQPAGPQITVTHQPEFSAGQGGNSGMPAAQNMPKASNINSLNGAITPAPVQTPAPASTTPVRPNPLLILPTKMIGNSDSTPDTLLPFDAKKLDEATAPSTSVAQNFVTELPGATGTVLKQIARAPFRAAVSVLSSAFNHDNSNPTANEPIIPETPLQKFIAGDEPIVPIARSVAEWEQVLKQKGYGKISTPIAFTGVTLSTTADLLPTLGGGENKAVKEGTAFFTEQIAKGIAKDEALDLLYRNFGTQAAKQIEKKFVPQILEKAAKLEAEKTAELSADYLKNEAKTLGLPELPKAGEIKPSEADVPKIPTTIEPNRPPIPDTEGRLPQLSQSENIPAQQLANTEVSSTLRTGVDQQSGNLTSHLDQGGSYASTLDEATGKVKPPTVRGGITPPELDLANFKDKAAFSLNRETFERNITGVAGKEAEKLQKFIVDPVRANETARIEFLNNVRKEIKTKIVDELGIKPGSNDDALVQLFGEKQIDVSALRQQTPKFAEVEEAAKWFRDKYDQFLDQINKERTKFGYDPIPKREDYFRHFQEIGNVVNQVGLLFRQQDLPTEIAGITDIFKPGKPFSTVQLARTGDKTAYSAIKGMENYIDAASRQMYHIDSVQRVRALEKYIREAAQLNHEIKLPSFVANVAEYGNLISGKAARLDRAFESVIGRRVFQAAQMLKNYTGINLVGGNISSALTNFIPFTQSLATTEKLPAFKGMIEAFLSPFKGDFFTVDGVKSNFLTRRFPSSKIAPTITEKVLDKAGWLFKSIDEFTSKSIVSGKYYEALEKGLSKTEAMKLADQYAGKVLADRSIGQLPNLFSNRTLGFLTQFQTEVNNMFSFVVKDIPHMAAGDKAKLMNSLAQFTLYSYMMNQGYQMISGRRPTIDPIYAGLTLIGQTEQSKGLPFIQRVKMAGKDLGGNLPFVNVVTNSGRLPVSSVFPNIAKLSEGDLTQLFNVLPAQIKKTAQGIGAYQAGEVTDSQGKQKYPIEQNPQNFVRTAVFGPSAVPEARNYYDNIGKPKDKNGALPKLPSLPKLPKLPKIPKMK